MAEFDPIANISRFSPTKHLQGQAASTGAALQKLMGGRIVQSDRDVAAGQRQKASDLSRLIGTLAPHGLSPEGLSPDLLGNIRGQIASERAGSAIANAAKGGVRFLGDPFQLPDVHRQVTTPGQLLAGEAMEKMRGKAQAELSKLRKITKQIGPGGKQVGTVAKEEVTEGSKIKGEIKSVDPEIAKGIINAVKSKFPELADKQGFEVKDLGDKWRIELGSGVEKRAFEWPKS
jgi:hypothetical protein